MIKTPEGLKVKFEAWMDGANVPASQCVQYRKWLRYYLDFCSKYQHPYAETASLSLFIDKLVSKGQSAAQRRQAAAAVRGYHEIAARAINVHCQPVPEDAMYRERGLRLFFVSLGT